MNDLVIADDDPVLVRRLSEIFEEKGYIVRTASNGFTALATMRDRVPNALIADLNLPRMSGFELLSIVRRRFPSIGVIAMSGADSGMPIPKGVAADAFYSKGSTSVARLLELVRASKDAATRQSSRAMAPIWISGVPIDHGTLATIAVACPECLRTFPHALHDAELLHIERGCPHCHHTVRLAIVRPVEDIDHTGLRESVKTVRICVPAYIR